MNTNEAGNLTAEERVAKSNRMNMRTRSMTRQDNATANQSTNSINEGDSEDDNDNHTKPTSSEIDNVTDSPPNMSSDRRR